MVSPGRTTDAPGLAPRLVGFVGALRDKGIPAGTSETVDAAAVAEALGLEDRVRLQEGLASALVRRGGQRTVFDQLFDVWFPAGVGTAEAAREGAPDDLDALRDHALDGLVAGDRDALAVVAQQAVELLGRVSDAAGNPTWSGLQTIDRLHPQTLVARAEAARLGEAADESGFTDRLVRDEVRRDVEALREMIRAEARRRATEARGRERMSRLGVGEALERTDFLSANRQQLAELRAAVRPLSRRLATRLAARRRRASRGKIDIRRTLRRSMGTGGVPVRPALRRPRPGRPELVLLCDVSGSVAGFSTFTMLLVRALTDQFSRVRVFAFVNAMDEVTDLVRSSSDDLAAVIREQAAVTRWHGSSDYGEALGDFAERYAAAVTFRTTVIVLGDGRTNYGDPNLAALQRISDRAKRVFWLNPEARARWGTGDSAAAEYAAVVDQHECRTVEQLSALIARLAPV